MNLPLGLDTNEEKNATAPQGLPEPKYALHCRGHEQTEQKLASLIKNGTLPQGLMLRGPKGIGKATLAHKLAQYLLAQPNNNNGAGLFGDDLPQETPENLNFDPNHPQIKLYQAGAHPDCLILQRLYDDSKNRYKDALDVGELRKITPFLRRTASYEGWRIVLIDDADTMNRSAQNALLKILEEPPKKTLIILIAHRPGKLLPTIHSRTQKIDLFPLEDNVLQSLLAMHETPPSLEESKILTALTQGSLGAATEIIDNGGTESFETISNIMEKGIAHQNWDAMHDIINSFGKGAGGNEKLDQTIQMLIRLLQLCPLCKAKNIVADNAALRAAHMINFTNHASLQCLVQISDDITAHFQQAIQSNLDKKHALLLAIHLIQKKFHGLS